MATSSTKKSAKTTAVISEAGENFVKALSEFQYQDLRLSRQQVFELQGGQNDETLLQLRYIVRVKKGTVLHQCAECGALFDNEHWLTVHGEKWHEFVCSCGWSPGPGTLDKATAMRRHALECPQQRRLQEEAHKVHVEQAKALQEAE